MNTTFARFEFLMAVRVKSAVFRNMTPCSLAKHYGVLEVPSGSICPILKTRSEVFTEMSVNFYLTTCCHFSEDKSS